MKQVQSFIIQLQHLSTVESTSDTLTKPLVKSYAIDDALCGTHDDCKSPSGCILHIVEGPEADSDRRCVM